MGLNYITVLVAMYVHDTVGVLVFAGLFFCFAKSCPMHAANLSRNFKFTVQGLIIRGT